MLARGEMQALSRYHPNVLQIALSPAAVAGRDIDQRGWAFFIRAAEQGQHVHCPTGAMDQRRLDEIMAQDMPAERRLSAQLRQSAMIPKGLCADDGVVAPIIAVAPHPAGKAGADQRTVDSRRKLLDTRKQRVAIDDKRQRLND